MPADRLDLPIPAEHPCYPDHFPGDPLVPAALLLQWIERRLRQVLPKLIIREIKSAKFTGVVRPGMQCELAFEGRPEKNALRIECRCNGITVCVVQCIATY